MQKIPEEDIILAHEGDSIRLRLESPDTPTPDNPIFLLDGSTEYTGHTLGFEPENYPTTSYSTSVHLEEPVDHVAHAIWATEDELGLDRFETIEEIKSENWLKVVEWEIHVFPESSTIDDIRQLIDDMIRVGTMAWAGEKLLKKINKRRSDNQGEEGDEDGEDHFQETLSNVE